jgi:hypothetical protein
MGGRRGALMVFLERLEERRTLGRGKRVLEDNIKMDLEEKRSGSGQIWMAGFCECGNQTSGSIKYGICLG